jgi:hypothetical protein
VEAVVKSNITQFVPSKFLLISKEIRYSLQSKLFVLCTRIVRFPILQSHIYMVEIATTKNWFYLCPKFLNWWSLCASIQTPFATLTIYAEYNLRPRRRDPRKARSLRGSASDAMTVHKAL